MTNSWDTTIDADAQYLTIEAMTKIYNHPHSAIVREYTANALDEHKASGTTSPVDAVMRVGRDVSGEYTAELSITDYGRGMSLDTLRETYTKIRRSSKRGDASQTGGFGIGAKAAFALANAFDVTTSTGQEAHILRCRSEGEGHLTNHVDALPVDLVEKGTQVAVSLDLPDFRILDMTAMLINMAKVDNLRIRIEYTHLRVHERALSELIGSEAWHLVCEHGQTATGGYMVLHPYPALIDPQAALSSPDVETNSPAKLVDDALLMRMGMTTCLTSTLFDTNDSVAYVSGTPYPVHIDLSHRSELLRLTGRVSGIIGFTGPNIATAEIPRTRESVQGMDSTDITGPALSAYEMVLSHYARACADHLRDADVLTEDGSLRGGSTLFMPLLQRILTDLGITDEKTQDGVIGEDYAGSSVLGRMFTLIVRRGLSHLYDEVEAEHGHLTGVVLTRSNAVTRRIREERFGGMGADGKYRLLDLLIYCRPDEVLTSLPAVLTTRQSARALVGVDVDPGEVKLSPAARKAARERLGAQNAFPSADYYVLAPSHIQGSSLEHLLAVCALYESVQGRMVGVTRRDVLLGPDNTMQWSALTAPLTSTGNRGRAWSMRCYELPDIADDDLDDSESGGDVEVNHDCDVWMTLADYRNKVKETSAIFVTRHGRGGDNSFKFVSSGGNNTLHRLVYSVNGTIRAMAGSQDRVFAPKHAIRALRSAGIKRVYAYSEETSSTMRKEIVDTAYEPQKIRIASYLRKVADQHSSSEIERVRKKAAMILVDQIIPPLTPSALGELTASFRSQVRSRTSISVPTIDGLRWRRHEGSPEREAFNAVSQQIKDTLYEALPEIAYLVRGEARELVVDIEKSTTNVDLFPAALSHEFDMSSDRVGNLRRVLTHERAGSPKLPLEKIIEFTEFDLGEGTEPLFDTESISDSPKVLDALCDYIVNQYRRYLDHARTVLAVLDPQEGADLDSLIERAHEIVEETSGAE